MHRDVGSSPAPATKNPATAGFFVLLEMDRKHQPFLISAIQVFRFQQMIRFPACKNRYRRENSRHPILSRTFPVSISHLKALRLPGHRC